MVIILIPSHFEAKEFIAGLENRRSFRVGEADCTEGKSGSVAVTVGVIGMGLPHAALRTRALLENTPGDHSPVILAGFAGALEPTLKRGDIFVTAGGEIFLPRLPVAERPREARLATVEKIAGTAASKRELFERTGAWLCDMEQAPVAQVVAVFGRPFIGIRIVSDEAQEDLPSDTLSRSYDQETGTYTPWKLAGHLTRNPFKTVPLAAFVRLLPPIRTRMSDHLHRWLKQTEPRLFE